MRLIEMAARRRDARPVRRLIAPEQRQRSLKPPDAAVPFRRQTHLRCEYLDEPSLTEADLLSEMPAGIEAIDMDAFRPCLS
jgi:hypothetical protein